MIEMLGNGEGIEGIFGCDGIYNHNNFASLLALEIRERSCRYALVNFVSSLATYTVLSPSTSSNVFAVLSNRAAQRTRL